MFIKETIPVKLLSLLTLLIVFVPQYVHADLEDALSYYKLDETSGARTDQAGSNDLTDQNTVTSVTSNVNNAAHFVNANNEALRVADPTSPDLSISSGDLSILATFKLDNKDSDKTIIGKYDGSNGKREYVIQYISSSDDFIMYVSDNTSNLSSVTNTFSPSTGTWYFLHAYIDNTNNIIGLEINNSNLATSTLDYATHNGTGYFQIGAFNDPTSSATSWDGDIDSVGIYDRLLSDQDQSDYYNGGSGTELFVPATTTEPTAPPAPEPYSLNRIIGQECVFLTPTTTCYYLYGTSSMPLLTLSATNNLMLAVILFVLFLIVMGYFANVYFRR
jgi:hypothetical protein